MRMLSVTIWEKWSEALSKTPLTVCLMPKQIAYVTLRNTSGIKPEPIPEPAITNVNSIQKPEK